MGNRESKTSEHSYITLLQAAVLLVAASAMGARLGAWAPLLYVGFVCAAASLVWSVTGLYRAHRRAQRGRKPEWLR